MSIYLELIKRNCTLSDKTIRYIEICTNAKSRIKSKFKKSARKEAKLLLGYREEHHIWPRCVCSSRQEILDFENLVMLTYEEHIECHKLLCDIFNDGQITDKMISGLSRMMSFSQSQHRMPSNDDKIYANLLRSKMQTNKVIALNKITGIISTVSKIDFDNNDNLVGAVYNKVTCKNLITNEIYNVTKEEFYADNNLVGATFGQYKPPLSEKHKNLISEKILNRGSHELIRCPHCHKLGGSHAMKRWHFDNCRIKLYFN